VGNVIYTETTTAQVLELVKTNLGISTTVFDAALTNNIELARSNLSDEGLTLDESNVPDAMLVVMYSTWLWHERETGAKMPRMLEAAINNKRMHQLMADAVEGQ
jgi:hypothetical protein